MKKKKITQTLGLAMLGTATFLVVLLLSIIVLYIMWASAGAFNWKFLSTRPSHGMTQGGILPAIAGTALVTLISTVFAMPFGVSCAVYLKEYAPENTLTRLIRASIRNLAGVPSIIYGLFGVALFVEGMGLGLSILSSGLTLGLLTLPYVITTTEEALQNVPRSWREGALALGATQWESIRTVILPAAMPGILTGGILALSRAAGETAPILFTGVAFYTRYLPGSLFDEFMALPYHLYILSTQHHAIEEVRPLAFATALALLLLVLLLNLVAFIWRARYQSWLKH